jgi:hypothetical protein
LLPAPVAEHGETAFRATSTAVAATSTIRLRARCSSSADKARRLGMAIGLLAMLHSFRGDVSTARDLYTEGLAIARRSGDKSLLSMALGDLALFVESRDGDHEASLALKREALEVGRALGTPRTVIMDNRNIACTLRMLGRADEANDIMREIVPDALRMNMQANLVYLAEDYGSILAELGHGRLAASLLGAADAMRERARLVRPPDQEAEIAEPMAKARTALSAEEWDDAYKIGGATPIDIVIARAYAASEPSGDRADTLTP